MKRLKGINLNAIKMQVSSGVEEILESVYKSTEGLRKDIAKSAASIKKDISREVASIDWQGIYRSAQKTVQNTVKDSKKSLNR